MANPFENIRQAANNQQLDRSLRWYRDNLKVLASTRPESLMSRGGELVSQIIPGNMYMFFYEAKLKDSLPYWDKFPLILAFRRVENGFYGINLHYLPYMVRFKVLGAMHNYTASEKIGDDTKVRINWQIVESVSKLEPARACVKHYLYDHVESRFLKIKYPDWITASQLPVERFVGATKETVWRETRKKY
jgi:hypothetical protein